MPGRRMFMVAGKADSQPLFPDDPQIAANRRVTITLMREEPPLPVGLQALMRRCWRLPRRESTHLPRAGGRNIHAICASLDGVI